MKKILFILLLNIFYSSTLQACFNLYFYKHVGGDQIIEYIQGRFCSSMCDKFEICLDEKTISCGNCTFYIQSIKNIKQGVMKIEFSLDKNTAWFYAPNAGFLIINSLTKNIGFSLDGRLGAYSYYNESDMQNIQKQQAIEAEAREKEREKIESQKKILDVATTNEINELISRGLIEDAAILYSKLHFSNEIIYNTIKSKLYSLYANDIIFLPENNLKYYIQENKSKLKDLTPKTYDIEFDNNGFPDNSIFPILTSSFIPVKVIGIFSIPVKSKTQITIDENIEQANNLNEIYFVSINNKSKRFKKDVLGNIYIPKLLNSSFLDDEIPKTNIICNESVNNDDKVIVKANLVNKKIYANEFLISENTVSTNHISNRIKNRYLISVIKGGTLLVGVGAFFGVTGLWLYETSLIE